MLAIFVIRVTYGDTHQLHLVEMMGFAGSTHPAYYRRSRRNPDETQAARCSGTLAARRAGRHLEAARWMSK